MEHLQIEISSLSFIVLMSYWLLVTEQTPPEPFILESG